MPSLIIAFACFGTRACLR